MKDRGVRFQAGRPSAAGAAALNRRLRAALLLALFLALSQPPRLPSALAQSDPCPEPNNGFNNACFIGPATPMVQGFLAQPGDVDAYRFEVNVDLAQAHVELTSLPADFDLGLWDSNASILERSANTGLAAEVIDLPLISGTYFLFVNATEEHFSRDRPYTLALSVTPFSGPRPSLAGDPCPEPNDAFEQACPLTPGRLAFGSLQNKDDIDTYRFEVAEANSRVSIRLGTVPGNFIFIHYDAAGEERSRTDASSTIIDRLAPGPYFVRVARTGVDPDPAPYELLVAVTPASVAPQAAQNDPCPEPNDGPDTSCNIGPAAPALGYISTPGDLDSYHFEVPGVRSWVHVELTDLPADYDLEVQDANGYLNASHNSGTFPEAIDIALDPGTYFIAIYSSVAQGNTERPYKLNLSMRPISDGIRPPSAVYFADNFNVAGYHFTNTAREDRYEVGTYNGEYVVKLHRTSEENVEEADEPGNTDMQDFQLDFDARMTINAAKRGGFTVNFRWTNDGNTYELYFDTVNGGGPGAARLAKWEKGKITELTPWTNSPAIRTGGQPNHVTIRALGKALTVEINGEPLLGAQDESFSGGDIALGAFSWDQPTEARFDNVIATSIR